MDASKKVLNIQGKSIPPRKICLSEIVIQEKYKIKNLNRREFPIPISFQYMNCKFRSAISIKTLITLISAG